MKIKMQWDTILLLEWLLENQEIASDHKDVEKREVYTLLVGM